MPIKDPAVRRAHHAAYLRDRYKNDPVYRAKHKARVYAGKSRLRKVIAKVIADWKRQGCQLCGELELVCLDAHHRDPAQKEFIIAVAIRNATKVSRVVNELSKCTCLCANCHRKVHAGILDCGVAKW